jgi:esterase
MSYKEMGFDILAIIEHEQLTSINLMGHSMGGKVAMWLALHYPAQISRLIVVDIAPKSYPLWHQRILIAMLTAPLSSFQSRQQVDHYLSQFIADEKERLFLSKNLQKRVGEGYKWRCNLKAIVKSYLKIATFPVPDLVFSNKTYFIRGGKSLYIEKDDYALIKQLFPKAEIYIIENATHLPHIEQTDDFYQQLKKILK